MSSVGPDGVYPAPDLAVRTLGCGGAQKPGDCNQDGVLDLSDGVCLLGHLFVTGAPLPCGDGSAADPANTSLLDSNGDAMVDQSDVVSVFAYLFLGESAPVLGTQCVPIASCLVSKGCQ